MIFHDAMQHSRCAVLLSILVGLTGVAQAGRASAGLSPPDERLEYTVSYQGALSLGLPVDIARADLRLSADEVLLEGQPHRRAELRLTTAPFPRMEAFYPLRFDYRSWLDTQFDRVSLVSMRKRSSSLKHDLIWFDHRARRVHTYRREALPASPRAGLPGSLLAGAEIVQPERFSERRILELGERDVLDRMGMLYRLRSLPLRPGEQIELPVSNGKDLRAYRIEVEAREAMEFAGVQTDALRIRLTPRFAEAGSRGYAVRVWLSDDDRRLPLRFSSSKFGGTIELRLNAAG